MTTSRPQIILRTAFDVGKYRNKIDSPVSDNATRKEQYLIGSHSFQKFLPDFQKYEVIIIDNTVKSIASIPKEFVDLWKNVEILCTRTNRYGKFNKGAGDVETLRYAFKNKIITTDFLFYELRLKTIKSDFIRNYLDSPRNLITREVGNQSVRSGYVGFEYFTAQSFYRNTSLISMTKKKKSIEDLLFHHWIKNSFEFFPTGDYALRFDPRANRYISY
jgi:hypothetical protein